MFVSLLCAWCQSPGQARAEQCVCTGVLISRLCSPLQASVFWSISYYSSPFAFFYLYRKGQCAFKGRGGGSKWAGHWPVDALPEEKEGVP